MDAGYVMGAVLAMGAVTFGLRALPFLAARWLQTHPWVHRLGRVLPLSIMALLTVHAAWGSAPKGTLPWAEGLAIALVVLAQWRFRHPLLSMALGTGAYVVWRNLSG